MLVTCAGLGVLQIENIHDVLINYGPSTRVLSPHGPCARVSKMTPVFTGRVGKKHRRAMLSTNTVLYTGPKRKGKKCIYIAPLL